MSLSYYKEKQKSIEIFNNLMHPMLGMQVLSKLAMKQTRCASQEPEGNLDAEAGPDSVPQIV